MTYLFGSTPAAIIEEQLTWNELMERIDGDTLVTGCMIVYDGDEPLVVHLGPDSRSLFVDVGSNRVTFTHCTFR